MKAPSIYDMRDNEIETAARIRRERVWRTVEAIAGVPILAALAAVWTVLCAAM